MLAYRGSRGTRSGKWGLLGGMTSRDDVGGAAGGEEKLQRKLKQQEQRGQWGQRGDPRAKREPGLARGAPWKPFADCTVPASAGQLCVLMALTVLSPPKCKMELGVAAPVFWGDACAHGWL